MAGGSRHNSYLLDMVMMHYDFIMRYQIATLQTVQVSVLIADQTEIIYAFLGKKSNLVN